MLRVLVVLVISVSDVFSDGFCKAAADVTMNRTLETTGRDQFARVPDVNGYFYQINLTSRASELSASEKTSYRVEFYVVTRKNPGSGRRLLVGDPNSLFESGFDSNNPTRILVHGWNANRYSLLNQLLSDSYLRLGEYNVINVDWSEAAKADYFAARTRIGKVGRKISKLVDFLSAYAKIHPSSVYLIGHSLGGHVISVAARNIMSGRIGAIVVLDAALPLFSAQTRDRIMASDADYVLSIHTSAKKLGIFEPIGHASFYPNWGRKQPGCGTDFFHSCSHQRAIEYFAESLGRENPGFPAYRCNSFHEIIMETCSQNGNTVRMGGDPLNTGYQYHGIFYSRTNPRSPFSVEG